MKSANTLTSAAAILLSLLLSACGGNNSSDGPLKLIPSVQLPTGKPDSIESFILEDLAGQPLITFVEFPGETIVTVRDGDGVRTESLRVQIDEQNTRTIQRAKPGEDWAKQYGLVEPSRLSAEFKAFQFYLKSEYYSQVQACRSSKARQAAVDSIRAKQEPVLFSIQARRKHKLLNYEAIFEIDIQTSRIVGITVDRGADAILTDAAYLAIEPHWVLDGRPSHTLLGPLASFGFDLLCQTNRTDRAYRFRNKPDTLSPEAVDRELSRFVDVDIRSRPQMLSVYEIFTRRRAVEIGRISDVSKLVRYKASQTEINDFYSNTGP